MNLLRIWMNVEESNLSPLEGCQRLVRGLHISPGLGFTAGLWGTTATTTTTTNSNNSNNNNNNNKNNSNDNSNNNNNNNNNDNNNLRGVLTRFDPHGCHPTECR